MKIRTQYLERKRKWTAFTTYKGYDYYELADDEATAITNLLKRLK